MEQRSEDREKKKRILIIAAILLLLAILGGVLLYNRAITAVTMRIQRLVGTVNLYTDGKEKPIKEKMRLAGGQTVTTEGESLIMVSLDDTKLMTMEESSKAEIKARGKKLLFNLLEGNLFFNVTEKLKDTEAFDIHTSTMICGIRGTSAYVGRDSTSHEILMVTDGVVHVVATNPVTKETTEVDVPAGQMITIYLDEEAEGDKTISIVMKSFKEEDLPAMALDTMAKNKELMDRVTKATGFRADKLRSLAKLSSKEGTSMYGEAAETLAAEGIEDSIPFMGYRASEMVDSANSAQRIAKEDLPLEIAILTGYRGMMDVADAAGYDRESTGSLMAGTRNCMEATLKEAGNSGATADEMTDMAGNVSAALRSSTADMIKGKLSITEIRQVIDTTTELYQDSVITARASGSSVTEAVDKVSKHVTGTVSEEMDKKSNGEETVIALLGTGSKSNTNGSADTDGTDAAAKADAADADITDENTNGTGEDGTTADATVNGNAAGGHGGATGGATSAELRQARNDIAYTNPETGVVALKDGTLFDPTYYAGANPDVVARYGTTTEALLAEWLNEGKAQGRPPIAPATVTAKAEGSTHSDPNSGNNSGGSGGSSSSHDSSSGSNSGSGNNSGNNNGSSGVNSGTFDGSGSGPTWPGTLSDGTSVTLVGGPIMTVNGSTSISLPLTLTDNVNSYSGQIDSLSQIDWQASAGGVTATDSNGNTASKNTDGTYTYTTASGTATTYPDTAYQNFLNTLNGATGGVFIPNSNGDFNVGSATVHYSSSNSVHLTVTNGSVTLPITYRNDAGQDIEVNSLSQISVGQFGNAVALYNGTSVYKNGTSKGTVYTCDGAPSDLSYGTYTETATEIKLINYMGSSSTINSSATINKSTGAVTIYPP